MVELARKIVVAAELTTATHLEFDDRRVLCGTADSEGHITYIKIEINMHRLDTASFRSQHGPYNQDINYRSNFQQQTAVSLTKRE